MRATAQAAAFDRGAMVARCQVSVADLELCQNPLMNIRQVDSRNLVYKGPPTKPKPKPKPKCHNVDREDYRLSSLFIIRWAVLDWRESGIAPVAANAPEDCARVTGCPHHIGNEMVHPSRPRRHGAAGMP